MTTPAGSFKHPLRLQTRDLKDSLPVRQANSDFTCYSSFTFSCGSVFRVIKFAACRKSAPGC
jgi:hypothetical protein